MFLLLLVENSLRCTCKGLWSVAMHCTIGCLQFTWGAELVKSPCDTDFACKILKKPSSSTIPNICCLQMEIIVLFFSLLRVKGEAHIFYQAVLGPLQNRSQALCMMLGIFVIFCFYKKNTGLEEIRALLDHTKSWFGTCVSTIWVMGYRL